MKHRVAIIGGGPGGLMTARHLENKLGNNWEISLFEASNRIGGKILTKRFDEAGALYEAGVAELYDYSMIGDDPLKNLVAELGLKTIPMEGEAVILGDRLLRNEKEISERCGPETLEAIRRFRDLCSRKMSPREYYDNLEVEDEGGAWGKLTATELLEREVPDWTARTYLRVAARSDLATEPHLTNATTALKNFHMDVSGYIRL